MSSHRVPKDRRPEIAIQNSASALREPAPAIPNRAPAILNAGSAIPSQGSPIQISVSALPEPTLPIPTSAQPIPICNLAIQVRGLAAIMIMICVKARISYPRTRAGPLSGRSMMTKRHKRSTT